MRLPPAIQVCDAADLGAALAPGRPVCLLSAPAAALSMGAGWWLALMQQACGLARAPFDHVLDCADAPGLAAEALRAGQRLLVLDPSTPAYARIAALAEALGGAALPIRPPAFDPGRPRPHRPGALEAWLAAGDSPPPLV